MKIIKPMNNRPQRVPISAQDIKAELDKLATAPAPPPPPAPQDNNSFFLVRTAGAWMEQAKTRPIPRVLFSEFWHEGELCILFADTNLGKSILAVQIGNSISRGEPIPGFRLEAPAQPILYFDFELSEKQFEARYSNGYTEHYGFNGNFYRAEINPDAEMPEGYGGSEELLNQSIETAIVRTGAKVLIIDNLTYLKTETEKAQQALPLMKQLKALKQRHGLSILALAHTPKRDATKPISKNDLQGSKMLMNFCDSAFAIGESHADKNSRYLKQIKQRYTESVYDADNVPVCQTTKPCNFLQFELVAYSTEWQHLKKTTDADKEQLKEKAKEMSTQGKSQRQIAKELGISVGTVNKYVRI